MLTAQSPDPIKARLVVRAIAGDREAFGDLYERHRAAIYRYVFYRVGEATEAEDLTATVFLKAWEALDHYRPGKTPFTAWLYRIAHNLLVDRYRKHKDLEPLEEHPMDPAVESNTEYQVMYNERAAAISRVLAQLEPIHQQVLTLRFINGLSHAETAQVIGRTEGTIRVLQHRALVALRTLLDGKVDDYE